MMLTVNALKSYLTQLSFGYIQQVSNNTNPVKTESIGSEPVNITATQTSSLESHFKEMGLGSNFDALHSIDRIDIITQPKYKTQEANIVPGPSIDIGPNSTSNPSYQ